jgi:DNA invertase Pin-like site-specific DNA recombinase
MKVALYARYSSENQKQNSIEDQYRNCEKRAVDEEWTVTGPYEGQRSWFAGRSRPTNGAHPLRIPPT